jgi:hypothetical protein
MTPFNKCKKHSRRNAKGECLECKVLRQQLYRLRREAKVVTDAEASRQMLIWLRTHSHA